MQGDGYIRYVLIFGVLQTVNSLVFTNILKRKKCMADGKLERMSSSTKLRILCFMYTVGIHYDGLDHNENKSLLSNF